MKIVKILRNIVIGLLVLVAVLLIGRNLIVKTAVETGVRAVTGLPLKIGGLDIGLFRSAVDIKNLEVYNPSGFPDKMMLDMPEIYVNYDLGAILKHDIHLRAVRINMREFVVVKNKKGQLNLDAIKGLNEEKGNKTSKAAASQSSVSQKGAAPKIRIDDLKLKVGQVIFKDYSGGGKPSVRKFTLNLNGHYKDIKSATALVRLIVSQALAQTVIPSLVNLNLKALESGAMGSLLKTTNGTAGEVGNVLKKTTNQLKGILKFHL